MQHQLVSEEALSQIEKSISQVYQDAEQSQSGFDAPSNPSDAQATKRRKIKSTPVYEDLFSEVTCFQGGCLVNQNFGQKSVASPAPSFIPIFPYLYKNLRFGNDILDGKGKLDKVKLFLNGREL